MTLEQVGKVPRRLFYRLATTVSFSIPRGSNGREG